MSSRLEVWGNKETMNLHNILYLNVLASPYFKTLVEKKTYHEVVDEIYYNVASLEPFFKGTNASSAFVLLYKLFTLKLTERQLAGLLDHQDSPHIRALGFLYLRYCSPPAQLWDWFEPYLEDKEDLPIKVGVGAKTMTIGSFCKALLTDQKWFDTILPRIPVPIARDIEQRLRDRKPGGARSAKPAAPPPSTSLPRDDTALPSSSRPSDRDDRKPSSRDASLAKGAASDRDRGRDRSRSRDRVRDRSRSRDRVRDRDRGRDRVLDRRDYLGRDRSRDRDVDRRDRYDDRYRLDRYDDRYRDSRHIDRFDDRRTRDRYRDGDDDDYDYRRRNERVRSRSRSRIPSPDLRKRDRDRERSRSSERRARVDPKPPTSTNIPADAKELV